MKYFQCSMLTTPLLLIWGKDIGSELLAETIFESWATGCTDFSIRGSTNACVTSVGTNSSEGGAVFAVSGF